MYLAKLRPISLALLSGLALTGTVFPVYAADLDPKDFQDWRLPDTPPHPVDNAPNEARVKLGMALFFDPRLSGDGNMACSTCHNPLLGWSDAMPTAKGFKSMVLGRATPTVVNTAYNNIQMWDGRKKSLEDQAMGPMESEHEMNMDTSALFQWLAKTEGYQKMFGAAYPGEAINAVTVSKAIASFERTVVSKQSRFDRWLAGDQNALTAREKNGFQIFSDENKGNCAVCHSAPNFTDNGFHNLGLEASKGDKADIGRYAFKPVKTMKHAFKTPTLRDIDRTAPYFHDGSAKTLMDVVEHYARQDLNHGELAPNFKRINLSAQDKEDLVAFMKTLTSPQKPITLPELPQ